MAKLTDKERLDRQLGKHKPERAADGLPKASRPYEDARRRLGPTPANYGPTPANYGPSASYTPATDNPTSHKAPSVDGEGTGII